MFCFFVSFCGWGGWWLWGEWGQTLLHGSLFRSHFLHGNWDLAVIRIIFATRSVYIIMIHCTCRYYIHLSCFDLLIYRSDDQIVLFPLNFFFLDHPRIFRDPTKWRAPWLWRQLEETGKSGSFCWGNEAGRLRGGENPGPRFPGLSCRIANSQKCGPMASRSSWLLLLDWWGGEPGNKPQCNAPEV